MKRSTIFYILLLTGIVCCCGIAFAAVALFEAPSDLYRRALATAGFQNHTVSGRPVVYQVGSVDCGAAAIANLLAEMGRPSSLSNIEALLVTSYHGVEIHEVVSTLREVGVRSNIERISSSRITAPVIALRNHHYVVALRGPRTGTLEVIDPWLGDHIVSIPAFATGWNGLAVVPWPVGRSTK